MKDMLQNVLESFYGPSGQSNAQISELYPGIALAFFSLDADVPRLMRRNPGPVLHINYCRRGRAEWNMSKKKSLVLGPGDFSIHTGDGCAASSLVLPDKSYEGLAVCIDLDKLTDAPPEILCGTDLTGKFLLDKFCKDAPFALVAGNEDTERIFSAFYAQPEPFRLSWQKLKILELLLFLGKTERHANSRMTERRSGQIETVREIHDLLTGHMEQRFTIEELSRQYLMNPTTLKDLFKSVYGTSLAAHIKEHRMRQAAALLRETDLSIAQIALQVGYDSQSKFSSAFKETFGQLPKCYRKQEIRTES